MDRNLNKKVGEIIKEYRIKAHLTQLQLARQLGLDQSTIACYEKGIRGLDLDTFFKICAILGIQPNDVQKLVKR